MRLPRTLLVLWLLLPAVAAAQRLPPAAGTQAPAVAPRSAPKQARPTPAIAVIASMLIPGSGQALQREPRWVPYLALEIWSWLRFRDRRADSRELTARYRDLAWQVARRVSVGERRDTVFEYYEALAQYGSSGAWDSAPFEDGLQPEQDTATFNGQVWFLARKLFFARGQDFPPGSNEYLTALDYYRTFGIPPAYAWTWGGSSLEQHVFADLIEESDDAYRAGTRMLGLILANHVASAVDALITARLRTVAPANSEFRSEVAPDGQGISLRTQVRVGF